MANDPIGPKAPAGFVSLATLKGGPAGPETALAEIRRIYFNTTRQTIVHDLAHAVELLKSLESEEQREKASVYMEGLAQMRTDWDRERARRSAPKSAGPGRHSSSLRRGRPPGPTKNRGTR